MTVPHLDLGVPLVRTPWTGKRCRECERRMKSHEVYGPKCLRDLFGAPPTFGRRTRPVPAPEEPTLFDLTMKGAGMEATTVESGSDVMALATLQFADGGLFDSQPTNGLVHLIRSTRGRGTPGGTLCGIDRFAETTPGWSVGGGVTGPDLVHTACSGCVEFAATNFPGLPVRGMKELAGPVTAALEVASR